MIGENEGYVKGYRLDGISSISYIPDFLSQYEAAKLTENVRNLKYGWTEVKGRRLQNFGGRVEHGVLLQVPFPRWLQTLVDRLHSETGVFSGHPPNHVLLNAYLPGQGIHSHQDGPIYHPGVCILSLGASAVMNFRQKLPGGGFEQQPASSVLLQPRSLLIFCDQAYEECLHGIDEITADEMHGGIANLEWTGLQPGDIVERKGERISLTVRRILKTRKNILRL